MGFRSSLIYMYAVVVVVVYTLHTPCYYPSSWQEVTRPHLRFRTYLDRMFIFRGHLMHPMGQFLFRRYRKHK